MSVGAALRRLAGQMRVGDLAAHDGDQIGLARGDDGFGILGRADMCLGGDAGVVHHRFQLRGQRCGQLFGMGEGRDDALEFQIAAIAAGDVVHMRRWRRASATISHKLLGAEGDTEGGGIADREADDEVLAAGAADALDQRAGKAGAVFQTAAPLVGRAGWSTASRTGRAGNDRRPRPRPPESRPFSRAGQRRRARRAVPRSRPRSSRGCRRCRGRTARRRATSAARS